MTLSDREVDIVQSVLFQLQDCEQIKFILIGDFSPDVKDSDRKNKLNAYKRNCLIEALVFPLAKLFFVGQLHGDTFVNPDLPAQLVTYLKTKLGKMTYATGWLSGVSKKEKTKCKRKSIK